MRPWLLATLLACACAPAGSAPPGGGSATVSEEALVPPGHGSLRQDEVSLSLQSGSLQVRITPLEEWVLRLTAPDTYARLSELAGSHRTEAVRRTGASDPTLFLVSFFSPEEGGVFEPQAVSLLDRGRRHRPTLIRPLTAGWGTQRLGARETQSAVYAFDGALNLDMGLVAEYRDARSTEWDGILQRLQSELARARARAGGR